MSQIQFLHQKITILSTEIYRFNKLFFLKVTFSEIFKHCCSLSLAFVLLLESLFLGLHTH